MLIDLILCCRRIRRNHIKNTAIINNAMATVFFMDSSLLAHFLISSIASSCVNNRKYPRKQGDVSTLKVFEITATVPSLMVTMNIFFDRCKFVKVLFAVVLVCVYPRRADTVRILVPHKGGVDPAYLPVHG